MTNKKLLIAVLVLLCIAALCLYAIMGGSKPERPLIGRWETDIRLALGVQNVFVITGYSGGDPEVISENGIDGTTWPRSRTYSLRLNVNF